MLHVKRHEVTDRLKAAFGLAHELVDRVRVVKARARAVVRADGRLAIFVLGHVGLDAAHPVLARAPSQRTKRAATLHVVLVYFDAYH